VIQRTLVFAGGLLVLVLCVAPSLDFLAGNSAAPATGGAEPAIIASAGPPTVAGAVAPGAASIDGGTAIDRDAGGRFHVAAMVNDQPVRLLVDTGADTLALSETDARSIGVVPDPAAFTVMVNTASGTGYAAHARIDRLEVAGHDVGGVDALVVRGLGTSLLGMAVLRRVGTVTMSGDRMFIGN
jgi:aspartyl protease family protein